MRVCREVRIAGVVQGVGLRPWAAREARLRNLAGQVRNTPGGVVVQLEGPEGDVRDWLRALRVGPPPGAKIERVRTRSLACRERGEFRIEPSALRRAGRSTRIPPDAALCGDCAEELFDPAARRHRYAFTHCAVCGPRASVLLGLPFDRQRTSLARFEPCARCRAEYADPRDRRHHAQTLACPDCGPQLFALDPRGGRLAGEPLELAARTLEAGGIVALKGYCGFHLIADATRAEAVRELRRRKGRPSKPFAVLVADLDGARDLLVLERAEEALLSGPIRPVLIAPRRPGARVRLAAELAPSTRDLGVLLPHAPAQLLLLWPEGSSPARDPARFPALVFTSANRSDEPVVHEDAAALRELAGVADLIVTHDREIARPADDSVYRTGPGRALPLRLSRGSAPGVVKLPGGLRAPVPIAALGGDLKCAPALARDGEIWLAEHVGDLSSVASLELLERRLADLAALLGTQPALVAHDLHPGYAGTQLASSLAPRALGVQHHHAHAIACLLEHGRSGPALALVLDGGGFGPDRTLWGGELLWVGPAGFRRLARIEPIRLVGGDSAVRQPWRSAAAWLVRAYPEQVPSLGWHERRVALPLARLERCIREGRLGVETSSCGRLFDAVASLLDLCDESGHEAEAAIALESLAAASGKTAPLPEPAPPVVAGSVEIPVADLVRAVVEGRIRGEARGALARAFHFALADRLVGAARRWARAHPGLPVALSGGCFQNRLLLSRVRDGLIGAGLEVLAHECLPAGDGALAVGQAAIAAAQLSRED